MDWRALIGLRASGYTPRALLDVGAHLGAFSKTFVEIFPGCAPVLIEPNPHCADALSSLPFETHAFAASHETGDAELNLTSEWLQSTGASLYRENTHFFRDEVLQKIVVPKRRIDDVFGGRRFDVVKIDTQGAELDVLRGGRIVISQADYLLTEISLVDYNAGGARAEDVFAELSGMGFTCAGVLEFHRLQGVANGSLLQMDFLFENNARKLRMASTPAEIEALAALDLARGDIAAALEGLNRLRHFTQVSGAYMQLLQSALAPAIEKINAHIARNELAPAAAIATPLARLLPGYAQAQQAAMMVCANMSDYTGASEFARGLLALKPDHGEAARLKMRADVLSGAKPKELESARRGLFPPLGYHPMMILRDLHDAATALQCGVLQDGDLARLQSYIAESRDLAVDVPDTNDLPGWLKHYRLSMDAMDPAGFLDPVPSVPPVEPPALATSMGEPLSGSDFRLRLDALNPSVVFFVAADPKYIELYANHYIDSVVSHCDVSHAIVLHVIGGVGRLGPVASSLGRSNPNIFFTGDGFDAASIQTKCFDTPPKGQYPHPAAHFQSARFQQLGWLLAAVNRPVFVSDIDLLLQRGVADLLAREAGQDIVLNENEVSWNAGSRLTANLLLLNPTPAAAAFVRGLKFYLDRHLSRPEVSRWIDQFGLLMARHRLRREVPGAKIGYFDTKSDINNLMYRTYEKNPFRFLSLYHGFDMESLKRAA